MNNLSMSNALQNYVLCMFLIFFNSSSLTAQDFQITKHGLAGGNTTLNVDSSGNFIVSWTDASNAGYPYGRCGNFLDIYAQEFNMEGELKGGLIRVTKDSIRGICSFANQGHQDVSTNKYGNSMFVWQDFRSNNTNGKISNIYAQFYSAGTIPKEGNFRINEDTTINNILPKVLLWDDNSFVVIWLQSTNKGNLQVYARSYDSLKNDKSKAKLISEGNHFNVKTFGNDKFVVIINSTIIILSKNLESIKSFNIPLGNDIDFITDNDSTIYFSYTVNNIFESFIDPDIFLQKVNINDQTTSTIKVNDDKDGYWQLSPKIALEDNNIVVMWSDFRNSGFTYQASGCQDIYAQKFTTDLKLNGTNFKVSHENNTGNQGNPSILLKNNKIIAVWLDGRSLEYFPIYPPRVKLDIWGTIQDYDYPIEGTIIECSTDTTDNDTINPYQDNLILRNDVYPNPTSNNYNIYLNLSKPLHITITLFDVLGRKILILYDAFYNGTIFNRAFHLDDYSSGLYILDIFVKNTHSFESRQKKIIKIK